MTRDELDELATKARDLGDCLRRLDQVRSGARSSTTQERNVAQSASSIGFHDWSRFYELARIFFFSESHR